MLITQCKHRLKENRELLEREIRPEKCVDDFLEGFILDLDEHEEILVQLSGQRKNMAKSLFDKVLSSVEKGSYDVLMKVLERQNPKRFKRILEKLECTSDFQGKNVRCIYFIHNKYVILYTKLKYRILV